MTSALEGPSNPYNKKWYVEGKRTLTLDLLIGSEELLGKGLAGRMIQEFILDKFSDADFFIIDPAKSNPKAIHVYEKAGFEKVDEFCPSYDPIPYLMMRLAVNCNDPH
jgi:RimJ/RimL family protein N-acetyltransferase